MDYILEHPVWDYPLSTYAKFSDNFSENFAYVLKLLDTQETITYLRLD